MDFNVSDLWESFGNSMLMACDEVCGKKKGRKDRGDTWWWNKDVQEIIAIRRKHIRNGAKTSQSKI